MNDEIFSEEAIQGDLPSLEKYKKVSSASSPRSTLLLQEMKSTQETTWERLSERPDAVEKSDHKPPSPSILLPKVEEQKPSNDAGYVSEEEWSMRNPDELEDTGTEAVTANVVGIGHDVFLVAQFFKGSPLCPFV